MIATWQFGTEIKISREIISVKVGESDFKVGGEKKVEISNLMWRSTRDRSQFKKPPIQPANFKVCYKPGAIIF